MSLSGEVFSGGATTSQHVEAQDDDHFENTTFKLKRTRSMGLLDEFIPEKLSQQQQEDTPDKPANAGSSSSSSSTTSTSSSLSDDATTQQQENSTGVINFVDNTNTNTNTDYMQSNQSTSESPSPSPVASPTPTPALDLQSPELLPHDDTDLTVEPSRHVDYLSHQWDVSDIWKSWRYVISKRKDVANAARLENASWRTWAQRRSNLKTISPEVVNWSKDSDVTWLYGPILKDDDHVNNENHEPDSVETTATSSVAGDISIAKKCTPRDTPKPILKRRTVEQLIISHSNLLKLQLATQLHQKKQDQMLKQQEEQRKEHQLKHPDEYFDPEALLHKLNSQYKNFSGTNNSSVAKLQNLLNSSSSSTLKQDAMATEQPVVVPSSEQISKEQEEENLTTSSSSQVSKSERHIHFNDEVMQCIAVDEYSDDEDDEVEYDSDDDYDDNYDYYDEDESSGNQLAQSQIYEGDDESIDDEDEDTDDDDDDDDGGFFIKVRSNSNAPLISGQHSANANNDSPVEPVRTTSLQTELTEDSESISTTNSRAFKTIQLLPSTSINYGSDESSDEENPYTSSLSHNVNNEISRGYDYYYDYNTVYTSNPNQTLYGSYESPDVVDVPENLDMGSNFDYEFIENSDTVPVIDTSSKINNLPISYSLPSSPLAHAVLPGTNVTAYSPNFPIVSDTPPSQATVKPSPFQLSDSENESESEDEVPGLSIGTRRSSQALAELVFNSSLTSSKPQQQQQQPQQQTPQHFPDNHETEPVNDHISSINPRYSSTAISKQPTSSSSLSQLFFGAGGLTNADRELSKLFLGGLSADDNNDNKAANLSMIPKRDYTPSPDNALTHSLSNTTKKSSPLPPHTTSENAFRGSGSPSKQEPHAQQPHHHHHHHHHGEQQQQQQLLEPRRGGFLFDDDSSDSEDEGMVLGSGPNSRGQSYNALSQVAGKNGIQSPSPTLANSNAQQQQQGKQEEDHKNLMGQAKGLAKHFFG
ncbi:Resistance to glucose repression protein 1 [Candida viswanathii]|uniref:Resistance to glucose repression protein 1 n=1 Tax=Candida viswanathii TaxID=5486 RepID=A0A367XRX3_9ASCO|nr:Resistance to glucose repression protein 1 [Candida viswanathii]